MGVDIEWQDAAKFLTGFSAVRVPLYHSLAFFFFTVSQIGSVAIPFILHHGHLITLGATLFSLAAFIVLSGTLALFIRVSLDDGPSWSGY
ncbi:hypothetical protein CLOM_g13084 [Closterium sp. NIES-68]|nr:hypothetical protein CLOM_g13084 [Closterium sp. NIES-68]